MIPDTSCNVTKVVSSDPNGGGGGGREDGSILKIKLLKIIKYRCYMRKYSSLRRFLSKKITKIIEVFWNIA